MCVALVAVPSAWTVSYLHDLHRQSSRLAVKVDDLETLVRDLVHLLTVEDRS